MARKPADQSVSREEIIVAAAEVLKRHGYEATTMKDIAAQVNLTAASLYHHFTNKQTLLLAVLEAGLDNAIERVEPVVKSKLSFANKLREMIRLHITTLTENPAFGAAMVFEVRPLLSLAEGLPGDSTVREELRQMRDLFFTRRDYFEQLFRGVVAGGIAEGEFRAVDVPIVVKAMLGAHNWVGVWYRDGGRLTGDQISAVMADTFLNSLTAGLPAVKNGRARR
jgi:TetR/AcrR family transcriptional regulator, cholesterol catabolism regulator